MESLLELQHRAEQTEGPSHGITLSPWWTRPGYWFATGTAALVGAATFCALA